VIGKGEAEREGRVGGQLREESRNKSGDGEGNLAPTSFLKVGAYVTGRNMASF